VLIIKSEDGADVIKAVDYISITFLAVAYGQNYAAASTDGSGWTYRTLPSFQNWFPITDGAARRFLVQDTNPSVERAVRNGYTGSPAMGERVADRAARERPLGVYTAGEHCKKCYSCVRICPTKAIVVHSGEANIIAEKCISCGYCVDGCSQGAKKIRSAVADVVALLESGRTCSAIVAPSFPAAFPNLVAQRLVGALAACGFAGVYEVAYGADLVSGEYFRLYRHLVASGEQRFIISSPCPAVVSYVEKICPELVPHLAPIESPMEAMATVVRERTVGAGAHGAPTAVVFVGPCVAKKDEALRSSLVDEVLTFQELRELFEARGVDPERQEARQFDPPHANLGRIYPVTGGLLKAAAIDDDLLASPVAVVEGNTRVTELLQSLNESVRAGRNVETRLFDLLFCEGCIAGPAITSALDLQGRKKLIVDYMKDSPPEPGTREAPLRREDLTLDFSKAFRAEPSLEVPVPEEDIRRILAMTGKVRAEHELNCRACGYGSCREKAVAVFRGIAEVEMCLPYLITKLETAISDLKENQGRLIHAEKLASMGQMAAGIAHELNNPLGVILMYAHLLKEDLAGQTESERQVEDVNRIIHESERSRSIVQGILNFARDEKVDREPTDVNALLSEAIEAARALDAAGQIRVELDLDDALGLCRVDRRQMRQVFDNIIKNAIEAMPGGGLLAVESRRGIGQFAVAISDTGPGIPEENLPKLFSPFFTTKPAGKGTGLGLVVCYGIVKMHGGSITAANRPGGGARFEITVREPQEAG
jgi:two-component system NtrC family sensor kinase